MDMLRDPIVEEVRKARNEHAAKFNNNIDEIVKDIQGRQKKYGSRLVRRPPRMKLRATGT
jgi:intein/homing endonuclease